MTHPGYTAKDLPKDLRPWHRAKPEEFWNVSGGDPENDIHSFYDCVAHVLEPRPGHPEDHHNPRFQLVMHDGSGPDDIVPASAITHAHPMRLVDGREQKAVFRPVTENPEELLPGQSPTFHKNPQYARLSVNLSSDVEQFIRVYMKQYNVSATEATRRAFSVLAALEEAHNARRIIQVCKKNGEPLYELVMPK